MGLTQISLSETTLPFGGFPPRGDVKVALVSMPFYGVFSPSLPIGLLKAIADRAGFPAATFHLNLDFAARIGLTFYERLCDSRGFNWGDWLFSASAFGKEAPDPDARFLAEAPDSDLESFKGAVTKKLDPNLTDEKQEQTCDNVRAALRTIRNEAVPAFIEEQLAAVPWHEYGVVGFTSTFQQNVSSLALAAAIKRQYPDVLIVFGGANFDGEMGLELLRANAFIDYAFIGEADESFPEMLQAVKEGTDPSSVPGVVGRTRTGVTELRTRQLNRQLDNLPIPDYFEYFERARRFEMLVPSPVPGARIPFESARGCWWGEKHHCTFCGLNSNGMAFRSKSPARVIEELSELSRRHQSFQFAAVDNIVDHSYHRTLFKDIRDAKYDFNFFYEVKANLSREQLRALREAGLTHIQPGIESLSDHVLRLMEKGITGIQNVNLLRWCQYYGIKVAWNVLWGFPHETEQDYVEQLELMKHLVHLCPPSGFRIWMERFSPIFFDRKRFPAKFVKPERSYHLIYPQGTDLEKIAYFFEYELENALPDSVFEPIEEFLRSWERLWAENRNGNRPYLHYFRGKDLLVIEDRRDPKKPATHHFGSPHAEVYASCSDSPMQARAVSKALGRPEEEVQGILDEFCAAGLMMKGGGGPMYLSLALPMTKAR